MQKSKWIHQLAWALALASLLARAPHTARAQQAAASPQQQAAQQQQQALPSDLLPVLETPDEDSDDSSIYVRFDSWTYPAIERLFSLGYVDSAFMGFKPWTRLSCLHMLEETYPRLLAHPADREAWTIFGALAKKFGFYALAPSTRAAIDNIYARPMQIVGTPVNNSFHFGQTIINDDGRPFQKGFDDVTGFSASAESGRFSLFVRGEYQHAPGRPVYPQSVSALFSAADSTPLQPQLPVPETNVFHLLDANLSFHFIGHEISVGKVEDDWGPARTGGMALSYNADPIYALRINRVEPLRIPLISDLLGPVRYEFLYGDLKGDQYPNAPWLHAEKFSFKPTRNLEFGFSRVVVFGGTGVQPVTFRTFWNSFASFSNVPVSQKFSINDPGARHSQFDFTWRLPWLEKWLTLYSDSIVHDDVSPLAAPRRAAVTPGIYLSHFPGAPRLDLRVEAVSTDPPASSQGGQFIYYEVIYKQGYLNSGNFFGSWMGREGKGGQAWLTYWLSPKTFVDVGYRNAKVSKTFIPGGTTQNDFNARAVLRLTPNLELNAFVQQEFWTIPALAPGRQSDFVADGQLTYFPRKWRWGR